MFCKDQKEIMQEMFSNFPELLLIDATYKLNDLRMPLYIMMVVDGNGESDIVALWIVASEDRISLRTWSVSLNATILQIEQCALCLIRI